MTQPQPTASQTGLEHLTRCLMCGSEQQAHRIEQVRDFFFKADESDFTYVRCADCGSLWLEERPYGERLLQAYAAYYTHAEPETRSDQKGLRQMVRRAYVRSRYAQPSGLLDRLFSKAAGWLLPQNEGIDLQYRMAPRAPARVLDYGCGSGAYLVQLEPLGYALAGAEYDPKLLAALSARGIDIADVAGIEALGWEAHFDHITLSHVLEHVPDPAQLLARLHAMLKPGGSLYLVLPNGEATGLDIFGRYWRGLEAPRHFALPSRRALAEALVQAGFVIERQPIDRSARRWVWEESLGAAPSEAQAGLVAAMRDAPAESADNAEFLTFLARKPI